MPLELRTHLRVLVFLIIVSLDSRSAARCKSRKGTSVFDPISRRNLFKIASIGFPISTVKLSASLLGTETSVPGNDRMIISDLFPAHPPEHVREIVTVAHFDLKRVKELVESRPSLARAAWDWGFGDWETPLGAASHMGNRPIAEYLLSQGAPPSLFSAAMLGQLDAVKTLVTAEPGAQRLRGPHSISLLAHARMGGEAARPVFNFLQSLGDADADPPAPLTEDETAALVGTYIFGVGVAQQVDLTADLKMYVNSKMYTHSPQLNWTRKGTMPRPLFHLGNRTFYPAGAPSVRIHFTEEADGMLMNIRDGELAFSAIRNQPARR